MPAGMGCYGCKSGAKLLRYSCWTIFLQVTHFQKFFFQFMTPKPRERSWDISNPPKPSMFYHSQSSMSEISTRFSYPFWIKVPFCSLWNPKSPRKHFWKVFSKQKMLSRLKSLYQKTQQLNQKQPEGLRASGFCFVFSFHVYIFQRLSDDDRYWACEKTYFTKKLSFY